ncbi:MAG: hypothetical protein PHO79_02235 [Desulfoplanes sp.]|nr:hypothetical protein [Desulfoplanes sp.]
MSQHTKEKVCYSIPKQAHGGHTMEARIEAEKKIKIIKTHDYGPYILTITSPAKGDKYGEDKRIVAAHGIDDLVLMVREIMGEPGEQAADIDEDKDMREFKALLTGDDGQDA